ncbi:MAG TPA: hypothetical protein VNP95_06005 [Thermomicrobiales bacterium]|nr:hypothetical protein [Thermomicrobiales bacterium]
MQGTSDEPLLVLVPSPLLGAAVWGPVAEALRGRGLDAVVAPAMQSAPASPLAVVGHLLGVLPAGRPLILVPHSNAGLLVPFLTVARPVMAAIFVDARLPPSSGRVPTAEGTFRDFLEPLADTNGLLPPWTQWWSDDDLDGLYPTPDARRQVEREAPRLPLAYFDAELILPDGWDSQPCAYLAFGETYGAERADAATRGWPTAIMPGDHLHMLHDPVGVAERIVALAARARRA